MSDETTKNNDWSSTGSSSATPGETPTAAERAGFCQDCGRPLTPPTARTVGTGVFCEPCLTARVGATAPPAGYTTVPPYGTVPPAAVSEPSPVLAAILGLIPGVGAMYNGQFSKGIAHLAVFAILVSLSDNVNGIFGLFVAGWVFYMAFEAYHTAIARRDGLPLPNAFGFNNIGERMGFGKTWAHAGPATTAASGAPFTSPVVPIADPTRGPAYVPVNSAPMGTSPDWVGYVPPTAFGAPPIAAAQPKAPWGHASYAETYTGGQAAYGGEFAQTPGISAEIEEPRFPTGALWLIGLGVLILVANLLPDWKLTARWWPPVLFAGLAVWTFTRRMRPGARLFCIIRWPAILMVLAIMLALHAANVLVTFGLICSILLIVFGGLLLLERAAGGGPVIPATPPAEGAVAASHADIPYGESHPRAAWESTESNRSAPVTEDTKDGQ